MYIRALVDAVLTENFQIWQPKEFINNIQTIFAAQHKNLYFRDILGLLEKHATLSALLWFTKPFYGSVSCIIF